MASEQDTAAIYKIFSSRTILRFILKHCDQKSLINLASCDKQLRACFAPKVFQSIRIQGPHLHASEQLHSLIHAVDEQELTRFRGYVQKFRIVVLPLPQSRTQGLTYGFDRSEAISDAEKVPIQALPGKLLLSIPLLPNLRRLSVNLEALSKDQVMRLGHSAPFKQKWTQLEHLRVIASEETEALIISQCRNCPPGQPSNLRSLQISHGVRSEGYLQARRYHGNLERLHINLRFDNDQQDGMEFDFYNVLDNEHPDPEGGEDTEPVSLDALLDLDYLNRTGPNSIDKLSSLDRSLRAMRPLQARLIARHFPGLQRLVICEETPPTRFSSDLRGPKFESYIRLLIKELRRLPNLTRLSYTVWKGAAQQGRRPPPNSTQQQSIGIHKWYENLINMIGNGLPQLCEVCILTEYPYFYRGFRPEGAVNITFTLNRFDEPSVNLFPMGLME